MCALAKLSPFVVRNRGAVSFTRNGRTAHYLLQRLIPNSLVYSTLTRRVKKVGQDAACTRSSAALRSLVFVIRRQVSLYVLPEQVVRRREPDLGRRPAADADLLLFPHPIFNLDRKSTRLNSSHQIISYAVFCLKKKKYKIHCVLIV